MDHLSYLIPWKYKTIHASILAKTIKHLIMEKNLVNTFVKAKNSLTSNNPPDVNIPKKFHFFYLPGMMTQ